VGKTPDSSLDETFSDLWRLDMKMVKAAVMEEPGRMVTREFPYPEMKPGALILKVELSGICGTDKHIWQGETHFYAG
jgi:L-iditol 2-dehydrogenase